jgi:[protein-PII] uridylyltransferase
VATTTASPSSFPDRAGMLSRVAGVCALHGLDVLEAAAASEDGWALEVLRVEASTGPAIAWPKVVADVEAALEGRLALEARLADRIRTYAPTGDGRAALAPPSVRVDNDASATCTVLEVHAPTGSASCTGSPGRSPTCTSTSSPPRSQTLGPTVVDAFYVRDGAGRKVDDPEVLVEVERALLHALAT